MSEEKKENPSVFGVKLGENTSNVGYCNIVFGDNMVANGEYVISFSKDITLPNNTDILSALTMSAILQKNTYQEIIPEEHLDKFINTMDQIIVILKNHTKAVYDTKKKSKQTEDEKTKSEAPPKKEVSKKSSKK